MSPNQTLEKLDLIHDHGLNLVFHFADHKVVSSIISHLETHSGFFKLFMKGIFNPYVL